MAGATTSTPAYRAQELGREIKDLSLTPASDAFRFNEREREILGLWDREEELRLEINVLKAQHDVSQNGSDVTSLSDSEVQAELSRAEKDLLTARSTYAIRQNLVQHVLIADPLLKSIHSSQMASPSERRLLPLIHERDTLAMVSSTLSSQLQGLRQRIARLQQENVEMLESNRALAGRMVALAEDAKVGEKPEDTKNVKLRRELEILERELAEKRREWRVWKSVVGGVVAGSGVDWTQDASLLEAVMDEEDEMG